MSKTTPTTPDVGSLDSPHIPQGGSRSKRRGAGRKYSGPNAWMVRIVGNQANGNRGHQPKKARNRKGGGR